jgi:hypothetical protein
MADELVESPANPQKRVHNYPKKRKSVANPQPIGPNPAIQALEMELIPLMTERMTAGNAIRSAQAAANRANQALEAAREELARIEGEVNYRLSVIAQMKGQQFQPIGQPQQQFAPSPRQFADYPVPPSPYYAPVTPYPAAPVEGVGSYPAPNRGLYPDATPRFDDGEYVNEGSATEIRRREVEGGFGGIR